MRRARDRGFSLIELIAVVLIVGVLAVVAVVAYRKWISTARINEATNMISNIRSAEEAFKSENGGYLPVSVSYAGAAINTPTTDYPALTPGAFKKNWGDVCLAGTQCVAANSWKQLAVAANGAVMYGYAVVATNDPTSAPTDILVNGAAQSITALKGAPWYVVEGDGDPTGIGKFTKIFGLSGNNELFINEQ
jgi:prepilin-type N-terminal cleavage/methylation domain-containing protein